jgi:hypothetical protein
MIDLAGLPLVLETSAQFVQQSQATIGSLQQQSAAIRATISLVKLRYHWLAKNSWKQPTLCCAIVKHEEASGRASNAVLVNVFVAQEASFVFKFKNYSG